MKEIKKVCVVGAGQMGKQIALNTAIHGYETYLTDSVADAVSAAEKWAKEYLQKRIAKGKMDEATAKAASEHFHPVVDMESALKGSDLVIECIIEKEDAKRELFKKVDQIVDADTILATNSSNMPSSTFAKDISHPERLANLHYFNPALVMELTEVVQGPHTSDETIEALMDFSTKTGKSPIHLKKEIPGFVCNNILAAIKDKALYLVEEGICTPQEVDTAVEKGLNYPMGPFRLMDMTGLDLSYYTAKAKSDKGEKVYGLDLLEEKYKAHEWGRKTGKGWYDYTSK